MGKATDVPGCVVAVDLHPVVPDEVDGEVVANQALRHLVRVVGKDHDRASQ
jgi:hypothetical protein